MLSTLSGMVENRNGGPCSLHVKMGARGENDRLYDQESRFERYKHQKWKEQGEMIREMYRFVNFGLNLTKKRPVIDFWRI